MKRISLIMGLLLVNSVALYAKFVGTYIAPARETPGYTLKQPSLSRVGTSAFHAASKTTKFDFDILKTIEDQKNFKITGFTLKETTPAGATKRTFVLCLPKIEIKSYFAANTDGVPAIWSGIQLGPKFLGVNSSDTDFCYALDYRIEAD